MNIDNVKQSVSDQANKVFGKNKWGKRHADGWSKSPIAKMIEALAEYADKFDKQSPDYGLSNDYILGEHWKEILRNVRGLLNGEIRPLEGGSCDEIICKLAEDNGFDVNDL